MKKFVVFICLIVSTVFASAQIRGKLIFLEKIPGVPIENPWEIGERSLTNELIASYDEEYVYVIADKFEGKAEIVFSNGKNVVYDVFSVCFAEGEKKAFPMDRMGEGKCFIEIKTDNCYYYGCFEITQ